MGARKRKAKRRFFSVLQRRILLVVFLASLVLQSATAVVAYFLVSADLMSKRNDDMNEILTSLTYNLSSPTLGQGDTETTNPNRHRVLFLESIAQQVFDSMKTTYGEEAIKNLELGTREMSDYLYEFMVKFRQKSGLGMSSDGTPSTIIENLLFTMSSPSSSKYIYLGFVDSTVNRFVICSGSIDYVNYPEAYKNATSRDSVAVGYCFDWTTFSSHITEGSDFFAGAELKDPVKGHTYASGMRLSFENKDYWIITETDSSYFTDQTNRFALTFLVTSVVGFVAMFAAMELAVYFLFLRKINMLSTSAEEAVDTLGQGELRPHFTVLEKKRMDEMDDLNNDIAYLESELQSYMQDREAQIQKEERNRAELAYSAQIQLSSLPSAPVDDEALCIYPRIKLAKEVGGDLYDYFYIDDHRFVFLVGDVSGKGVPAALFMMQSISKIKAKLNGEFDLGQEIKKLNDEISSHNPMNLFITSFIGLIDTEKNTLTYVNCGHEEIFFRHNGRYIKLEEPPNLPLGAFEGFEFEVKEMPLSPYDALYLYTDGVSEAEDINGVFFGKERIEEALNVVPYLPSNLLVETMLRQVEDFQSGKELADDICMLSLTYKPGKKLTLKNKLEELNRMQDFIYDTLKELPNPETATHISLAMDELAGNVIYYAYGENEGTFEFTLMVDEENRIVHGFLIDSGKPFNPLEKEPNSDIANTPGGLGILMAKDSLDEITYQSLLVHNVLYFNKRF